MLEDQCWRSGSSASMNILSIHTRLNPKHPLGTPEWSSQLPSSGLKLQLLETFRGMDQQMGAQDPRSWLPPAPWFSLFPSITSPTHLTAFQPGCPWQRPKASGACCWLSCHWIKLCPLSRMAVSVPALLCGPTTDAVLFSSLPVPGEHEVNGSLNVVCLHAAHAWGVGSTASVDPHHLGSSPSP